MFERFTDRARRVVVLAQEEARMLNHNYIGTEHILLGLVREDEGVAARILLDLDAEPEKIRSEVMRTLSGPGRRGHFRIGGIGPTQADILSNARAENHRLLRHQPQTRPQRARVQPRDLCPIQQNAPRAWVIKAQQQG